jgi:hypothetical protein
MAAVPYKVYVVVDREFGEKLAELERGVPVWIVDTPTNKPAAQRFWNERPHENHLTGITTFNDLDSLSPEEMLLGHLDTIELHHGSHSADPPYTVIEVFGTQLTANAKSVLSEYGFNAFDITSTGFTASRLKALDYTRATSPIRAASCARAFLIPALTAQAGVIPGIKGSSEKPASGRWVGNGHFAFCWEWPWQVPSPSSPCWRGDTSRWSRLIRDQAKERSLSGPHPAGADP